MYDQRSKTMKTSVITLSLLFTLSAQAFNFPSPREAGVSKLIMDITNHEDNQYPMLLLEVNGENIQPRGYPVWLKPGKYELTFSTAGYSDNHDKERVTRRKLKDLENTMTLVVEPNKTYRLAYDTSDNLLSNWKPVITQVKNNH